MDLRYWGFVMGRRVRSVRVASGLCAACCVVLMMGCGSADEPSSGVDVAEASDVLGGESDVLEGSGDHDGGVDGDMLVSGSDTETGRGPVGDVASGTEGGSEERPARTDTTEPPERVEPDGEHCATAYSLEAWSVANPAGSLWPYRLEGGFGASDDYNPYDQSGLPPGCSPVFDASGKEVVYAVELEPGQTLSLEYRVLPSSVPGGVYFLDSCPAATWPDYDMSSACGNNEYASQGFCTISCDALGLSLTHPLVDAEGNPTGIATYWLVLDTVGETPGDSWVVEWRMDSAE